MPEPTSGAPWRRALLWFLLLVVLVVVALVYWLQPPTAPSAAGTSAPAAEVLPVYGEVPDFELTNRDGSTVRRADLEGAPWIADFVFTRCQVTCPMLTTHLARMQNALDSASASRLVSFTVDPDYDTPAVLQEYAARFHAGERWLFLTGERSAVYSLIRKGFQLGVQPGEGTPEEPISHSTRFVLVDGQAQVRGYYESGDPAARARLLQDLARLEQAGAGAQ